MVYLAAGISGLTGIVGIFFVKDYLNLSAAFLAGLGFWTGIPWALKMPLGHLVDLIWNKKNYLVVVGAALISLSLLIMYGLIVHTKYMATFVSVETWFVISSILAPVGYVIQDVVADAMTVEAIPIKNADGQVFSPPIINSMHTTMQTLGRFSIITISPTVSIASSPSTINSELLIFFWFVLHFLLKTESFSLKSGSPNVISSEVFMVSITSILSIFCLLPLLFVQLNSVVPMAISKANKNVL